MMKMNKKLVVLIAAIMFTATAGIQLANTAFGAIGDDMYKGKEQLKREREQRMQQEQQNQDENQSAPAGDYTNVTDEDIFGSANELPVYYPNATMKSAIAKYKNANYTGCIQELYSILKKDKNNSMAYYYLAMAYIKAGKKDQAQAAYTRVINLNRNDVLVDYSIKGIDCLNGAPSCVGGSAADGDEMDKFISSPYGNGFSEQVNTEWKKKQLQYMQNKINKGGTLTPQELQRFNELNKSEALSNEKLALADNGSKKNSEMPSNDEIIDALNVLKRAGLNISTQTPEAQTRSEQPVMQPQTPVQNPMAYTPDPQYQQMSMMLNGGNNNTPDPMMYMVPYMMNANNGQNIDPKVIQSMMMNSMMNSLNSMNSTNNNNN